VSGTSMESSVAGTTDSVAGTTDSVAVYTAESATYLSACSRRRPCLRVRVSYVVTGYIYGLVRTWLASATCLCAGRVRSWLETEAVLACACELCSHWLHLRFGAHLAGISYVPVCWQGT
jgi:hypothetical protein